MTRRMTQTAALSWHATPPNSNNRFILASAFARGGPMTPPLSGCYDP